MSALSVVDVRTALRARLLTLGAVSVIVAATAGENRPRRPPGVTTTWLTETLTHDGTELMSMPSAGGVTFTTGLWLLDLFIPAGAGSFDAEVIADAILAGFPIGDKYVSNAQEVLIQGKRRRTMRSATEPLWHHLPLEVQWRAEATN